MIRQELKRHLAAATMLLVMFSAVPVRAATLQKDMKGFVAGQGLDEETRQGLVNGTISKDEALDVMNQTILPESLRDNRLEFSEIRDIVTNYSVLAQNMNAQLDTNKKLLEGIRVSINASVRSEYDEIHDLEQQKKDTSDVEERKKIQQEIREHRGIIKSLKAIDDSSGGVKIDQALYRIRNSKADSAFIRMTTKAMEDAFFGVKTLEAILKMYQQIADMRQSLAVMQEHRLETGMTTVVSAEGAVLDWQAADLELRTNQEVFRNTKATILLNLGWTMQDYDDVYFGEIPEFVPGFIASRDLEKDMLSAKQNSTAYAAAQRNNSLDENSNYKAADFKAVQDINVAMSELYSACLNAEQEHDAALTTMDLARMQREKTARLFQQGMVGMPEYKAAELSYIQSEFNAVYTEIAAVQAQRHYTWGTLGQF